MNKATAFNSSNILSTPTTSVNLNRISDYKYTCTSHNKCVTVHVNKSPEVSLHERSSIYFECNIYIRTYVTLNTYIG